MSVPVRGRILHNREGRFTERHASEISERLMALERALRGDTGAGTFASPEAPTFGPGAGAAVGPATVVSTTTTETVEEHDHDEYVHRLERTPHVHPQEDVVGLEQTYYRRGEAAKPAPHVHSAEELGFDSRFYRRGERTPPEAHAHVMKDVADLRPDDEQFVLASRMFGG